MDRFVSIKENRDFRRIYAKGKTCVRPLLVTYALKNRIGTIRVGITTSKKTGNAVKRNRSRRVIREAFRRAVPSVREGYDFIFVARARTPFAKSTDVFQVMMKELKEAGVLK